MPPKKKPKVKSKPKQKSGQSQIQNVRINIGDLNKKPARKRRTAVKNPVANTPVQSDQQSLARVVYSPQVGTVSPPINDEMKRYLKQLYTMPYQNPTLKQSVAAIGQEQPLPQLTRENLAALSSGDDMRQPSLSEQEGSIFASARDMSEPAESVFGGGGAAEDDEDEGIKADDPVKAPPVKLTRSEKIMATKAKKKLIIKKELPTVSEEWVSTPPTFSPRPLREFFAEPVQTSSRLPEPVLQTSSLYPKKVLKSPEVIHALATTPAEE